MLISSGGLSWRIFVVGDFFLDIGGLLTSLYASLELEFCISSNYEAQEKATAMSEWAGLAL